MMQFLDAEYKRMPSQIRRNFDKVHIDSVSVMAALLEALLSEAVIAHPLDVEVDVWGGGVKFIHLNSLCCMVACWVLASRRC